MAAFTEADSALGGLGKATLIAGAGVAAAFLGAAAVSTKWASEFQRDLTMIHTQAGDVHADLGAIGSSLEQMSTQVGYGPDELAQSLYHVESAGFRGAQAMDMVRQAAELAQVGGANLEDTTQAVVGSLAAFGDEGLSASQAVGILNATVGAGDMRMEGLASAMSTGILPAARVAGLSLTDVGAALATITDNVTPPEEAATRLRMTFTLLSAPTKEAVKALESVGLSSSQLSDDMKKPDGLLVAVGDLRKHLLDTYGTLDSFGAKNVIARAFGGGRSSSTIMTLLSEFDRFQSKYDAINQGADSFAAKWQETTQTTAFETKQFEADFQDIGTAAGAIFLPLVNGVMHQALPALQGLAIWMSGPGQTAFNGIGTAVGRMGPSFQSFAQQLKMGDSGADALTQLLFHLGVNMDEAGKIGKEFGSVIDTFKPIFDDAKKTIDTFMREHKKDFDAIWAETKQIMDALGPLVQAVLGAIRRFWHDHGQQIMQIVTDAMNFVLGVIKDALRIVLDVVHIFTDIFKGDWHGFWKDILQLLQDVLKLIVDAIQNAIPLLWHLLKGFMDAGKDLAGAIIEGIVTGIADGAKAIWNALSSAVGGAFQNAKNMLGIHSPSTKARDELGAPIAQGAAGGILDNAHLIRNALGAATSFGELAPGGSFSGLAGAAGVAGGGQIIFDFRGSQIMSDRNIDTLAAKLAPALGKLAVNAGIHVRR